ncbi:two-component regulator propeller domain-containing protein [Spirosoma areae]
MAQPRPADLQFERRTPADGLSQGSVMSMLQDTQGFIWLSTADGLNRYDGKTFKTYYYDPLVSHTVASSYIPCITLDRQGTLWIASDGGGLSRYNRQTDDFTRFRHSDTDAYSIRNDKPSSLCAARNGRELWVGTEDGLSLLALTTRRFQDMAIPTNDSLSVYIKTIAEDLRGNVWVGTYRHGLFMYTPEKQVFRIPLPATYIEHILCDRRGRLWVATNTGVWVSNSPAGKQTTFNELLLAHDQGHRSAKGATAISQQADGNFWIGTKSEGLFWVSEDGRQQIQFRKNPQNPDALLDNYIYSLLTDRQNNLWVGTPTGLNIWFKQQKPFKRYVQDAEHAERHIGVVQAIWADDREILLGGIGYIAHIDRQSRRVTYLRNPFGDSSTEYWALYGEPDGRFLVGSSHGLFRLVDRNGHYVFQDFPNESVTRKLKPDLQEQGEHQINHITPISPGIYWLSSYDTGLYRWDSRRNTLKVYRHDKANPNSLPINYITALKADADGYFWVLSDNGISRYRGDTDDFLNFPYQGNHPGTISCPFTNDLYDDGQRLWIGTYGGGLNVFNKKTGRFSAYTTTNGLSNNLIYQVLPDQHKRLWLSTNRGINRFNPQTRQFTAYGISEGLSHIEFNSGASFRKADGELFFGGVDGVTAFYPDQIVPNQTIPPVWITGMSVNEQPLLNWSIGKSDAVRVVEAHQNRIGFTFRALNFVASDKNQYRYRLSNSQQDWVPIGTQTSVNFSNLPPGDYTFAVQGSNNDGRWNPEPATVYFRIRPPFYQTLWFRAAMVLLLLGGLLGFYQYRLHTLQQRQKDELAVMTRTQEAERKRFAEDLHDGLGANLSMLKLYLNMLGDRKVPIADLKQRSESLLNDSLDDLRRLIHDLSPRTLASIGLVNALHNLVQRINATGKLKVTYQADGFTERLEHTLEIHLYRMVQELLQNALKHAQASHISLSLSQPTDHIHVHYRDNGVGFDVAEAATRSNGLQNIRHRAQLLGGQYELTSQPGRGTQVLIDIPI